MTRNRQRPKIKIGFLPTISALLGKKNDPTNVPIKNDEPTYPSSASVTHYKLYYKIQL